MEKLKRCCMCKNEKTLDCFGIDKSRKDSLNCKCKECFKIYRQSINWKEKQKIYRNSKRGREVAKLYNESGKRNKSLKLHRTTEKYKETSKVYREKNKEYMLLKKAKTRAKKNNLEFNITIDDIVIPEFCPVLGIPIYRNTTGITNINNYPSIDRIDNTKGYVKGNVCVISFRANKIKNDSSLNELEKIVEYIKNKLF